MYVSCLVKLTSSCLQVEKYFETRSLISRLSCDTLIWIDAFALKFNTVLEKKESFIDKLITLFEERANTSAPSSKKFDGILSIATAFRYIA